MDTHWASELESITPVGWQQQKVQVSSFRAYTSAYMRIHLASWNMQYVPHVRKISSSVGSELRIVHNEQLLMNRA
jgi:hypothetical protein